MVNSRNKGASFERDVKNRLHDALGLEFRRVLDQWAEAGLPDLTCEDDAFPFVIECKRSSKGNGCNPAWQKQATSAAVAANKMPVVIYKYNHREVICSLPMEVINPMYRGCGFWADISFGAFCYIAREWMAKNEPDTF